MKDIDQIIEEINEQLAHGKIVLEQEGVLKTLMLIEGDEVTEVFAYRTEGKLGDLLFGIRAGIALCKRGA